MNKQIQTKLQKIVKNNYQEIATHYSETRKKKLWPELVKLTEGVTDGDKILEVGCGSGKLLQALENKKIDYLGVDPCVELLEQAKEQFTGYKFRVGDILDLGSVPGINYDFIFCVAVLHHIPSKDLQLVALRQLRNKIKKDGKVILTVWNLWDQEKYKKLIYKFLLLKLIGKNKMDFGDILFDWKSSAGAVVSKRYYHGFRKSELKRLAKKAGFKIDKIYKDKFNYYLVLAKKS